MSEDQKKIIFSMVNVGKKYGTKKILKDISLSYFYGAKIGILGLNGAGKSTLLDIMSGKDNNFLGETHLSDGYSVGYLPQEPDLNNNSTVKEAVGKSVSHIYELLEQFDKINLKFGEDLNQEELDALISQQAKIQDKLDKLEAWTLEDKLNYAMEALACPDPNKEIKFLSGGEKRRVALCQILIQEPDILLLDEPTNHLDARSISWLEKHLQNYKGTVIAVTHDRYFLDNVAGWILELDRGEGYPFKGNYSNWLKQKQTRLEQESKQNDKRYKTLQRELEWINMAPKARQSKNKARINSYEKMLDQKQDQMIKDLKIYIPPGPRLGDIVINADSLNKKYENQTIFENLSFSLPAGGIVGVVGPNGVGKTTLFKMICGEEKLDGGHLQIGQSVKLGHFKQMSTDLAHDKTIYELISNGNDTINLGKQEINARTYVAQFNFTGQDQQKKISQLSGGEKNRVKLACLLKEEANLILLDEPSNDLDINTLRALEEALLNFAGCAVVISHDRWFLDRIATHLLIINGSGDCEWFIGNYSDYEEFNQKNKKNQSNKRYHNLTRT